MSDDLVDWHTAGCTAATEKWAHALNPTPQTIGWPGLVRRDPEAVRAWIACPHPSHETVTLLLRKLVPTFMAEHVAVLG